MVLADAGVVGLTGQIPGAVNLRISAPAAVPAGQNAIFVSEHRAATVSASHTHLLQEGPVSGTGCPQITHLFRRNFLERMVQGHCYEKENNTVKIGAKIGPGTYRYSQLEAPQEGGASMASAFRSARSRTRNSRRRLRHLAQEIRCSWKRSLAFPTRTPAK